MTFVLLAPCLLLLTLHSPLVDNLCLFYLCVLINQVLWGLLVVINVASATDQFGTRQLSQSVGVIDRFG